MAGTATTELPGQTRGIDARSVVTLVTFFIVNILVIFPISIPLPISLSNTLQRTFGQDEPPKLVLDRDDKAATAITHDNVNSTAEDVSGTDGDTAGKLRRRTSSLARHAAPPAPVRAQTTTSILSAPDTGVRADPNRWHFTLGMETAPVIAVIVLLAGTCIDGSVLRDGIVGADHVRPYDIMTLFLSFAYIAISLDRTNLLRWLAFIVATKAASSGRKLYAAFFIFFSTVGLLVGNDPLILSGTPFLAHFSRLAGISEPIAYLFTQFQTANLVSALLVSSNPTNLVLTSAFGITFLQYSAWLALPTVGSVLVLFPVLRWWVFRKEGMIPLKLTPPANDAANALHDPVGAIFGGVLFIITIIVLIALSAVGKLEGVEGVWTVTAPAAIVILIRDCVHDLMSKDGKRDKDVKEANERAKQEGAIDTPAVGTRPPTPPSADNGHAGVVSNGSSHNGTLSVDEGDPTAAETCDIGDTAKATYPPTPITAASRTSSKLSLQPKAIGSQPKSSPPHTSSTKPRTRLGIVGRYFPTVADIIVHLPLTLIPFAFAMFILVESLQHTGWIRVFGGWWSAWADVGGVAGCVFMMGLISVIGCNIFGTNIGATVLLSRVLQQWIVDKGNVSPRALYGSIFALAVGSNFGAYSFVFPASLAGLLWRALLKQKGLTVTRKQFARWNYVSLVTTMIVGCLIVAGEVCVMYDS